MFFLAEVDNLKESGNGIEYRELEGIIFRDESGKERRFKVKAIMNETTRRFRQQFPEVEWDENNIHLSIVLGEELKE